MGFVGSKVDGGDGIMVSDEEGVTEGVVVTCTQGLKVILERNWELATWVELTTVGVGNGDRAIAPGQLW
jgi:hypothetical protein